MICWVCFEISSIPGEKRNIRGCYCCWSVTCETKSKRWLNLFAKCKIWSPASKEAEEIATKKKYCFATKFKTFCNQVRNPNQSMQSTKNQSLQVTKNRACLQSTKVRPCRVAKIKACRVPKTELACRAPESELAEYGNHAGLLCWTLHLPESPRASEDGRWKTWAREGGGCTLQFLTRWTLSSLVGRTDVEGIRWSWRAFAARVEREREKTKTPASRHKRSIVAWSLPARCWACAARLRFARPQCCSRGLSQQHVVVFVLLFFSSCSSSQ
jgi:hypothetical protein